MDAIRVERVGAIAIPDGWIRRYISFYKPIPRSQFFIGVCSDHIMDAPKTSRDRCILPRCRECQGMYKLFLISITLIIGYWFYLLGEYGGDETKAIYADPLNKIVFNIPTIENCCSWWPLSHFILFFIIGVLFPECGVIAIIAGVLWELFEVGAHAVIGRERQYVRGETGVEYSQSWWAGSMKDIFFNIVGFYAGMLMMKAIGRKICIPGLNSKCESIHRERYREDEEIC